MASSICLEAICGEEFYVTQFGSATQYSEATATSERCIVRKLFTFHNPDLFYLIAYYLLLFQAKFQHLESNDLASITFSSKKPHHAKQLFISNLNGGLPL